MDPITPQQALMTLYNATRRLALPAEDHETLRSCAIILESLTLPAQNQAEEKPPESLPEPQVEAEKQ